MTDPAASPPSLTITTDIPCCKCHYNLRGLDQSGRCPECGTYIAGSVSDFKLGGVSLRWFQSLRLGLLLVIGVWILLVSGGLLNYFLYFFFFRNGIVPAWMTGDLFRLFWYVGICVMLCGWWGMQLFAEESHPADGQNHDNKSERRLRLAVNAEVAYHLFAMLCLSMLPVAVRQYAAVRILMSIVNALLDVWVHWTLFSLFGKIAGLVRCLSSARQASFLKILFAILCMAFVVQFCVLTAFSSEFSTRVFLWIYLGLALNIAFWIVRLWAIVIFIIVYRELGAFRSTASTTSEDARPFWVPQVVALLFQRLRKLASYASYHGPSQPT